MSYITDRHFTLSLTPGLAPGTTSSKPIEISWFAFFRNFMSAVKMLCSSLPMGRPLSTEGQIPGVMPIVIPSIFRGLSRILTEGAERNNFDTKRKFVEPRARGWSFARISEVSKKGPGVFSAPLETAGAAPKDSRPLFLARSGGWRDSAQCVL